MAKKVEGEFDRLVERMADSLVKDVEAFPELPPFGSVKLTRKEQLERYYTVRESPAAWAEMIQERGLKAVLAYAREMEKMHVSSTSNTSSSIPPEPVGV